MKNRIVRILFKHKGRKKCFKKKLLAFEKFKREKKAENENANSK